jgi:hypothetical protein
VQRKLDRIAISLEVPVSDGAGKIFDNVETTAEIAAIDTKTRKVIEATLSKPPADVEMFGRLPTFAHFVANTRYENLMPGSSWQQP